jgi:alpha-terpineol hydroxylase
MTIPTSPAEFGPTALRIPDAIAAQVIHPNLCADEAAFHEAFAWMREHRPLGWAHLPGYDPIWIVSKYADVVAVERRADVFLNMVDNPIFNPCVDDAFLRSVNGGTCQVVAALTHMDNPDHALIRAIATDYFSPRRMKTLEQDVRTIARAAVAKLLDGPTRIDFLKDFALEYPLRVILGMFGVPETDFPRMLKMTQEFFGSKDPEERRDDIEITADMAARQFHATIQDYYDYFAPMTAERRAHPRDDLMSIIANHRIDGEYLSDFYCNGYYITIATAGHDTTSSSSGFGMRGLCENPDQFALLKSDPGLIAGFVEEAIRMAAPVRHFTRSAVADHEVRGQRIAKGQRLMLSYPSASRDEDMFADPQRFDLTRKANRHLSFGSGPHMCLGQHLARIEIRVLFEELLPHLKSVRLAGTPRYIETNFVGGLKSLPIEFEKN